MEDRMRRTTREQREDAAVFVDDVPVSGPRSEAPPVGVSQSRDTPRPILHPLRRVHADEIEAAGDDELPGAHEAEAECLLLGLEHAVLVVEAVKVVCDADRVDRDRVRRPPLRRLGDDGEAEPFRLGLVIATKNVIARSLDLVGVEAPDRM